MFYTRADQIAAALGLTEAETESIGRIAERYPMRIPDYYLRLIDPADPRDPIRKMAVPAPFEEDEGGSFDTSGEQYNTKIPGLQHKYAQTAMVLTTNRCAMYCRHCFRKRLVGTTDAEVAKNFDRIIGYIREHGEITNVLLSGGDAFLNSDAVLERYLAALTEIGHLQYIRFGTRTPVTYPQRIDGALLELLARYGQKKQIYVVTQFNHPRELTDEARRAVTSLRAAGAVVRNQTVLLRGVNDDPAVLGTLLRDLAAAGCIPYYIFQCRPVTGVKIGFQVPLREAAGIVEGAKAQVSGMAKAVKFCLSHPLGKLEILGSGGEGRMLFKFHEAKDAQNCGRLFALPVSDADCWLPDEPELRFL